ncbi:MAG: DUF4339 domain-containing protein [Planctomycetes bacterium]|nr:DUF4339 domain-containing protein [Planctomycetota bacterium]
MASQWFCATSGNVLGPMTSRQLKTLAEEGRLQRDDRIRQGADGKWVAAAEVRGLFPEPASKPMRVAETIPTPPAPPTESNVAGPSAPEVNPGGDAAHALPHTRGRRRQNNNRIVIVVLLLALAGLGAVVAIVATSGTDSSKKPKKVAAESGKKETGDQEKDEQEKPTPSTRPEGRGDESNFPRPDRSDFEGISMPGRMGTQPVDRISPDSFQTVLQQENLEIEVQSAQVGPLPRGGSASGKDYLLVTVTLRNTGGEALTYQSWDGHAMLRLPVALLDNSGKMYRQRDIPREGEEEEAPQEPENFDPNVHPVHLTDENFEAEVLQAEEPVLVDFYADYCSPCRELAPTIERLAASTAGIAKIGKIDVQQYQRMAREYGIRGIPHLILFHHGEIVAQNPARSFDGLMAAIRMVLPGGAEQAPVGETLEPGQSVQQLLAFERTQTGIEFLRLELPADAVGGDGVLILEIPRDMVAATGSDVAVDGDKG